MRYSQHTAWLGLVGVGLSILCGAASAASTLTADNPNIAMGAGVDGPGGNVYITEATAGDLFGPGKTGTIDVQLSNHGFIGGIGNGLASGCWGTGSAAPTATPGLIRVTISAAPASAPSTPCTFRFGVSLNSTVAPQPSLGEVSASIAVSSTLTGLTVGGSTPFASWVTGQAAAALASGTVPSGGHPGSDIPLPDIVIDENAIDTIYADLTDVIALTLPVGYAWVQAGSLSAGIGNPPMIDPADSRRLLIEWLQSTTRLPYHGLRLSGQSIHAPAQASGAVSVTATVPVTGGRPITTSGFQVATITTETQAVPTFSPWSIGLLAIFLGIAALRQKSWK